MTGWAFANEHPRREMEGGVTIDHAPTRAFLLKEAWLFDGTLYKRKACSFLQPRSSRWPMLVARREIGRGAVYCTPGGNQYFGQWLMDDCATYPLAIAEGVPVTTGQQPPPHTPAYEEWLGMKPLRVDSAYLRELVVFEDFGQNRHKHARCRAMSDRLNSQVNSRPHPGVFIIRGRTGMRRVLVNEMEIAERLRNRRGFRILDPANADVPTIVATCAGANGCRRRGERTHARNRRPSARRRRRSASASQPFRRVIQAFDRPRSPTIRVRGRIAAGGGFSHQCERAGANARSARTAGARPIHPRFTRTRTLLRGTLEIA